MIRVELLYGRRGLPVAWLGPVLLVIVISGGLYGVNQLYPLAQWWQSSPSDEPVSSRGLWQEEPDAPAANDPWASVDTPLEEPVPATTAPDLWESSTAQMDNPLPAAETAAPSGREEVPPSTFVEDQSPPSVERAVVSSPSLAPQVVLSSSPVPQVQPRVEAFGRRPPQRSTVCQRAVRINEQMPAVFRLSSLRCNSEGEYVLEGTSPSEPPLRAFKDLLQKLPSQVSLSSWREGGASRVLRFDFQGRFESQSAGELATLSSDQAKRLFGKVAHWADESGLDGLSIKKPITIPLPPARSQQRQKLWATGSYSQIGAFLHKLQEVEELAALGELVLMPVRRDKSGWIEAQLYAAVDVIVGMP